MFSRSIDSQIRKSFIKDKKIILLLGPRRVGKTTLLKSLLHEVEGETVTLNGDYTDDRQVLRPERKSLTQFCQGLDYLFIDEAQNIP